MSQSASASHIMGDCKRTCLPTPQCPAMPSHVRTRPTGHNHAPPCPLKGSARREGSVRLGWAYSKSRPSGSSDVGHVVPVGLGCNWDGHPGGPGPGPEPGARGPGMGPGALFSARCELPAKAFRPFPNTLPSTHRTPFRCSAQLGDWSGFPLALVAGARATQVPPPSHCLGHVFDRHLAPVFIQAPLQ